MAKGLSLVVGDALSSSWKSCLDQFEDAVEAYPNSIALIACHQPADLYGYKSVPLDTDDYVRSPYLRWTYHELRSAVAQLATSLTSRGIRAGAPIFTFLPNGAEFAIVLWTADLLGCTLVPISIRNLANEGEVKHMIETATKGCPDATSTVVITDNAETATKLEKIADFSKSLKIVNGSEDWQRWAALNRLVARSAGGGSFTRRSLDVKPNHWCNIILFTSGTTSRPKGVKWGASTLSYVLAARDAAGPAWYIGNGDVVASMAPNNHAMGCVVPVMALYRGGTILYPGPYFEPNEFLSASRAERCTHILAVPTMIYALLLADSSQAVKLEHLKSVMLGGASVTREIVRLCIDELGAKGVENLYGMTEGLVCMSGHQQPERICRGNEVSIGRPCPGSSWKVCSPGSRELLPRLEVGELHGSLPNTQSPYIGRKTENFYEDEKPWFATGDSGYIDEEDRIFIVGRMKEMIIRGGENISPAAIESVINEQAVFRPSQIQIVGAYDQFAGEVPVGVVARPIDTEMARAIKNLVDSTMGKMYHIDDIVSLEDLGITDFPRTMGGKVQKIKLSELVSRHRQCEDTENGYKGANGYSDSKVAGEIKEIWARFAGVDFEDLKRTTRLEQLGDSITLMRVRDRVYKRTGINLTGREILESLTLGNMIDLAQSRAVGHVAPDNAQFLPADHPPTEEDMAHAVDDDEMFETTRAVVNDAIKTHGLSWEDVRDVMPAYDFTEVAAKNGTFEKWSFKIALLLKGTDVEQAQLMWKKAMANNSMQSSFLIWDKERLGDNLMLHVTLAQNDRLLDSLIEERGSLQTVADLKRAAFDMVMFQGAQYPGPLHRVYFYYVEETKCAGIVYNMHHAVTDASFAQLFLEDLDLALTGAALKPHVPYKLYCDSFYNLRTSPPARAATKYHIQKLKDLEKHISYKFPSVDRPLRIEEGMPDGIVRTWPATRVQNLIDKHKNISVSLVMKAATALFLLHTTNHTHAIFSQVEGARDKFPFMTNAVIEASKLQASDVGGQLYQSVLNLISLQPGETTIAFLNRLQEDASLQTKYASAPWKEIMRGIGGIGGELFPTLCTDCIFNWLGTDISTSGTFQRLQLVDAQLRRDVAKFVNNSGWLRDKSGDRIQIHLRGSVWSQLELEGFAGQIEAVTNWITDEKNWNTSIAEYKEVMLGLERDLVY